MKVICHIVLFSLLFAAAAQGSKPSLKKAFKNKFLIGVALGDRTVRDINDEIHKSINHHYNSIVAENCMKSEKIQPKEGKFDFDAADRFVEYGETNDMFIIGHTLVWHSQAPDWIFTDKKGNDVSREVLIERMRIHIHTLVGRYKGRVRGWDVVNEAILGSGELRKTKWLEIIGEDYMELAFQFAHEADPDAELYYNDYGMDNPGRRDAVVKLVKKLQKRGIQIDGIGMQAHYGLGLSLEEFEKSVSAFAATGLQVMITEFDITVLPFPSQRIIADVNKKYKYLEKYNPYTDGLPNEVASQQSFLYEGIFKILLKYEKSVARVTFWGLNDANTWKNNWPMKGRTDYPLLFDRNNKTKPAFDAVIKLRQ